MHLFSCAMTLPVMVQEWHPVSRDFWKVKTFTVHNSKLTHPQIRRGRMVQWVRRIWALKKILLSETIQLQRLCSAADSYLLVACKGGGRNYPRGINKVLWYYYYFYLGQGYCFLAEKLPKCWSHNRWTIVVFELKNPFQLNRYCFRDNGSRTLISTLLGDMHNL